MEDKCSAEKIEKPSLIEQQCAYQNSIVLVSHRMSHPAGSDRVNLLYHPVLYVGVGGQVVPQEGYCDPGRLVPSEKEDEGLGQSVLLRHTWRRGKWEGGDMFGEHTHIYSFT